MEGTALSKVAMHVTRGCLVVPLQTELYDDTILKIQDNILDKIRDTGLKGMIIDFSAVSVIDSFLARTISDTTKMASMLGATTVITGLRPGVVASFIDLDLDLGDALTAITLEAGFQKLKPIVEPKPEEDVEEELEAPAAEEEVDAAEDETAAERESEDVSREEAGEEIVEAEDEQDIDNDVEPEDEELENKDNE